MAEYDNRNSGLLFKSTSDHEKAPAFSGFWTDENNEQIKIKAYWSKNPDKHGNLFLQISKDTYEPKSGKDSPAWRDAGARLKKDVTENQQVPIIGTIEPDGTINYDEPLDIDSIPF